jgi:aryl-alcohol dehydrogenase-like predicted oxidoreductase
MEYHQLARTLATVSRIGFGCGPASGYDYGLINEAEWRLTVEAALENGINLFDVADVYGFGRAEEMLSEALGSRRHNVVIATKCGLVWDGEGRVHRDLSRESVFRSVEASLRRLRLDVIPLYQIHWPDERTPIEETLDALAHCQKQGKIRHVGVCNFPVDLLRKAYSVHPFQSEQVAFNLLCRDPEGELFPWCNSQGIGIFAHSGLARGFLSGHYAPGDGSWLRDTRRNSPYFSGEARREKQELLDAIATIARETGRSFPSIAIRWVLENPSVSAVLVGAKNRRQLNENLQAVGWQLEAKSFQVLGELSLRCPNRLAGIPAHAKSLVNHS